MAAGGSGDRRWHLWLRADQLGLLPSAPNPDVAADLPAARGTRSRRRAGDLRRCMAAARQGFRNAAHMGGDQLFRSGSQCESERLDWRALSLVKRAASLRRHLRKRADAKGSSLKQLAANRGPCSHVSRGLLQESARALGPRRRRSGETASGITLQFIAETAIGFHPIGAAELYFPEPGEDLFQNQNSSPFHRGIAQIVV